MKKRISIVLIDADPSGQAGVVAQIRAQQGFHVLDASADAEAALLSVRETRPDIVLVNRRPKGDDSLTLADALHREVPASRVIIMGVEPLEADVASSVRAGVSGFIMADASLDTLLTTIHSVARGIQVLPLELTRSLFGQIKRNGGRRRPRRRVNVKRITAHYPLELAAFSQSRDLVPSV